MLEGLLRDSEDEEVQTILSQGYGVTGIGQLCETEGARDWGRPSVNFVGNQTQDSKSIEGPNIWYR